MMTSIRNTLASVLCAGCMAGLGAGSAYAQKAEGVLRFAITEPVAGIDYYLAGNVPSVSVMRDMVFDTLILYNSQEREFRPNLATEWEFVDDTTIELTLRDDIIWHDGEKFDADDVVYTINYLISPDENFAAKEFYSWISGIEKVDQHRVRILTHAPTPAALTFLSINVHVYPEHVHGELEDKTEFGRAPVGTGPYRAVSVDRNAGIRLEKVEGWNLASEDKPEGIIEKFHFTTIPDAGARLAALLAGNVDLTFDIAPNQAASLAARDGYDATLGTAGGFYFIRLDAIGKAGVEELSDERVRRAILKAINRRDFNQLLAGQWADQMQEPYALCDEAQVGCNTTLPLPEYDPEGARELLNEVGVQNLHLNISAYSYHAGRIAEAISGQLREVGITSTIDVATFPVYRDREAEGRVAVGVGAFGGGAGYDVQRTIDYQLGRGSRDYHGSEEMVDLVASARLEMDPAKRDEMTTRVFDLATSMSYQVPLARFTRLWVHTDEVSVSGFDRRPIVPFGMFYDMLDWN